MLNRPRIIALLWLLLCSSCSPLLAGLTNTLSANPHYSIVSWDTEKGLPQSSVIAMTQTRDGYLWLGTLNGLARFDGVRFKVFDENNTPGLNSSRIVYLFEDSKRNLWIGTETAGVVLVKDGKLHNLDIGRGSREGRLMSACEDASGAVWLYTADGQLYRYRDGKTDVWQAGTGQYSSCRILAAEKSGPLWVGMDQNLFAIGPTTAANSKALPVTQIVPVGKLDFLLASQSGGCWRLADGRIEKWKDNHRERDLGPYPWDNITTPVTAVCEDRDGNLIVGTLGAGVFWYDAKGRAEQISTAQGLSHAGVLSLCMDREGTLWVGTDGGGLNRVQRQVFQVIEGTQTNVVQSVCEDDKGGLWIGSNSGEIDYWKDGVLQNFYTLQGSVQPSVRTVFVDRDQRVWVGTSGAGVFQLQNGQFRRLEWPGSVYPVVQAIFQSRDGALWFGTLGGLVRWDGDNWKIFTVRDGLSANDVRAIAEDAEGNIWAGTVAGLNRLRDGNFVSFYKTNGLPSDDISSLFMGADGDLWVGTSGGLARLDNGKFARFLIQDSPFDKDVGYLIEDDQSNVWMGSYAGLTRVANKSLDEFAKGLVNFIPYRTYGHADGLPTSECTQGSQPGACRAHDGTLWFPTIKGLAFVNPAQFTTNSQPPLVVIESMQVDGQELYNNGLRASRPQTIVIPPGKERLEIRYTSLNLTAPEWARFRYRMEGHEKSWVDAGDSRVAGYSKLPPGHYQFHVTACNEDGIWNEAGSILAITVEPPFWRTWWFISGTTLGLLGIVVVVVRYVSTQKLQRQLERLRQQEALEKERARIARDLHDQLGASLTQVSLLGEMVESDKDSPGEVQSHGEQIAQTARDTTRVLDEIVWAVNPSNDTLNGLINYICKYAQDYLSVAGLRYRLDIPTQLPASTILPDVRHNVFLAFKESVTNIVRHANATDVQIRLLLKPHRFTLEIEDNGRGPGGMDEKTNRNGLRNMRKRMEDIGGIFSIDAGTNGGTLIRLAVPIAIN